MILLQDKCFIFHIFKAYAKLNQTFLFFSIAPEVSKLKSNAPFTEIIEAMVHPQNGLSFLSYHPSLPSQTFVSAEASQWLNTHIEGGMSIKATENLMEVSDS